MTRSLALAPKTPEFFSETVVLAGSRQVLGRSSTCDIIIDDNTISRQHAEILADAENVQLRDLGSLNGTYVNEARVTVCEIRLADQVRFGRVCFLAVSSVKRPKPLDEEESTAQAGGSVMPGELSTTAEILSPAEGRIFNLLVHGLAEKQIASQLKISRHTVHNHVKAIYRQLGVHSRPELLARFLNEK